MNVQKTNNPYSERDRQTDRQRKREIEIERDREREKEKETNRESKKKWGRGHKKPRNPCTHTYNTFLLLFLSFTVSFSHGIYVNRWSLLLMVVSENQIVLFL